MLIVPIALVATIGMPILLFDDLEAVDKMVLAVAPSLLILCWLIISDRFQQRPAVVLTSFVLGGLSIGLAAAIGLPFLGLSGSPVWIAFMVAAIPEESAKLLVLLSFCARHRAFHHRTDGLVYGVAVALGFAALENVAYLFGPNIPADTDWMVIGMARAFMAVPMHAVVGATMGFFVGVSRAQHDRRCRWLCTAWIVAVALHGSYDWLALTGSVPLAWFVMMWILMMRLRRKLERGHRSENPEIVLDHVYQPS